MIYGQGKITLKNGYTYEGQLVNGTLHGEGKEVMTDGNVYTGDFVTGRRHGLGILQKAYGKTLSVIYSGDWMAGVPHGMGKERHRDGPYRTFDGNFELG